jgi:cytochrome bd-type quinol oxidase subunit 2
MGKTEQALGSLITYDETGDIALKNQNTLRKTVGTLGMLLPLILFLFLEVDSHYSTILPSISHYYFTRASGVFLIIVSMLSVFLLIYKGEEPQDFYLSAIAGISSLLLLLFPTGNLPTGFKTISVTCLRESEFRENFHLVCAAVFLLSLAYMSAFLFTRSDPKREKTKRKKIRNIIYIICAILIVSSILCLVLVKLFCPSVYDTFPITFWMEVVAVEAFGFSWLVKGKAILEDTTK